MKATYGGGEGRGGYGKQHPLSSQILDTVLSWAHSFPRYAGAMANHNTYHRRRGDWYQGKPDQEYQIVIWQLPLREAYRNELGLRSIIMIHHAINIDHFATPLPLTKHCPWVAYQNRTFWAQLTSTLENVELRQRTKAAYYCLLLSSGCPVNQHVGPNASSEVANILQRVTTLPIQECLAN